MDETRHGQELPAYALKVRELRKKAGLTQPQLGRELKTNATRVTVARWEGGVSEPRVENCLALAELAKNQKLPELAEFFFERFYERERDRIKQVTAADDLRYLKTVETAAAAGDESAQRLLKLSRLDAIEFAIEFGNEALRRITEARQSLGNGAFQAALFEMADETNRIGRLLIARELRGLRRAAVLRRQEERLIAHAEKLLNSGQVQREILGRIFDEIPGLPAEGKTPDIVTLAKRVADVIIEGPRAGSQKGQMISGSFTAFKISKISELFKEAAAAEKKGEPLDSVQFMKSLEEVLEICGEPKKPNEKK
jgi:transcriptional regulator with XRE-family HTH domain